MLKHKLRPVVELYGHGDCAINSKVEFQLTKKFMKKFSRKSNHVKVQYQESSIASVPCPSNERFERVTPAMGKKAVDSSYLRKASVHQASDASTCQNSYAEDIHCLDSLNSSNISEDLQLPRNVNSSQTTVENSGPEVLDGQDDDSSCVSRDNSTIMVTNDSSGDADHKKVTSVAASVSSCPAGLDKSSNIQSTASGSSCDPFPVEEGNKYSGESVLETVDFSDRLDPSEIYSLKDKQGSATPLKAVLSECGMVRVPCPLERVTDSVNLDLKCFGERCLSMDPEAGCDNEKPSATGSFNDTEGNNKYQKYRAPITNIQELPLQDRTTTDNDRPDELVEVNVCDICGDAGREALLALCSKCSDGAEHIYCMLVKLDKVPEGDWICEDCTMMQDAKRKQQTEVARLDVASNPSSLKEVSGGLPGLNSCVRQVCQLRTYQSGKDSKVRTNHFGNDACLSGTKRCSGIELSSSPKRKGLETSVRLLNSSGCGGKMTLTRASSLKITDREKKAALQAYTFGHQSTKRVEELACLPSGRPSLKPRFDKKVGPSLKSGSLQKSGQALKSCCPERKTILSRASSLMIKDKGKDVVCWSSSLDNLSAGIGMKRARLSPGHGSPKPQCHIGGGDEDLCASKSINMLNIEVRRPYQDVNPERKALKESSYCQLTMKHPRKKLLKSMSFSSVRLPSNVPQSHFPCISNVKDLNYSGGRNSTGKYDSVESKSPFRASSIVESGAMKVNASRTTLASKIAKAPLSPSDNVQDIKIVQDNENSNVKAPRSLTSENQNSAIALVRSAGEDMMPSNSSHGISSTPKKANSYPDLKANEYSTLKVGCGRSSIADIGVLIASDKVPSTDSHSVNELPSPVVPSITSAVPKSESIWKGAFELEKGVNLPKVCCGIQAHASSFASPKVAELVHRFHSKILFKEVPRLDTWPVQFQRNHPTEQDIGVYFFAKDLQSYSRSYKVLLEGMMQNDLALEANFDEFQFLVFPSSLLPARSQRWNTLSFLWGVFRLRKVDNCSIQNHSLIVATVKPGLESVDPMALHSPALTKSMDHGGEHEKSSTECLSSQKKLFRIADASAVSDAWTEKKSFSSGGLHNDGFQKGDGYANQALAQLSETRIFSCDPLDKENMMSSALAATETRFCSPGKPKLPVPSCPLSYDPASKFQQEKRLDVASWSSISADSGPSGSFDGGGCAKSDEVQVDQSQNPGSCVALDLNLCLGPGFEPEEQVNLNLALGFSCKSKYQPEHCTMDESSEDVNVSLDLSLGM